MNPETGQFEELEKEEQIQKAMEKNWQMYEVGEVVDFKGWAFEIVNVMVDTQRIVLKPLTPNKRAEYFATKAAEPKL